jgi:hypothetical protein
MLIEENWKGAARTTVSKGSSFSILAPDLEEEEVLMLYFLWDLEILAMVVFRRTVALEEEIMLEKICQFPPDICIAPSIAMQTIASRPWSCPRFWA